MARQRRINILLDRSRDGVSRMPFLKLHQHAKFTVTDNERRLTAPALKGYSVLIAGLCGVRGYTKTELAAVRAFVRRGEAAWLSSDADGAAQH